jgi:hypothetical protein
MMQWPQILKETYTACVGCHDCSVSSSLSHQVQDTYEEIQISVSAAYVANLVGFLAAPVHDLNDRYVGSHGHFLPDKKKRKEKKERKKKEYI